MIAYYGVTLLIVALAAGTYRLWARRVEAEIREGAADEWAALRRRSPEILDGYTQERFTGVYRRAHFPRFPGYALAAAAAFVLSLPVTLGALSGAVWLADRTGLAPSPSEVARYVPIGARKPVDVGACTADCQMVLAENFGGFFFFFAIIAIWLAIFAFFMRRYYARMPGDLREELVRGRA